MIELDNTMLLFIDSENYSGTKILKLQKLKEYAGVILCKNGRYPFQSARVGRVL